MNIFTTFLILDTITINTINNIESTIGFKDKM